MQQRFSDALLVHGFALAHGLGAAVCAVLGVGDTLLLTLLTIALTLVICIRGKLSVEFSIMAVLLVNVLGYVLGLVIAKVLGIVVHSTILVPALSTFTTTEAIGWALVFAVRTRGRGFTGEARPMTQSQVRWLMYGTVAILLVRALITSALSLPAFSGVSFQSLVGSFFSNSFVLVLMLLTTILAVRFSANFHAVHSADEGDSPQAVLFYIGQMILYFIVVCALSAVLCSLGAPFASESVALTFPHFMVLFFVAFVTEAVLFALCYILASAISARRSADEQRTRADRASYEYLSLKQQVDPHFLFNSLNVLDYLVGEGDRDAAKSYIHKLSGVYRYMLGREREPIVPLREELEFARMYIDLLKVRFSDGFVVVEDVPDSALDRYVVPSSLQMLVENAVKHNVLDSASPLEIVIDVETDPATGEPRSLRVSNNRRPKTTKFPSTGVGLKYVSQTYRDHGGRDIDIVEEPDTYSVQLPLL